MDKRLEYLFDTSYKADRDELRNGILRYRCKTITSGDIKEIEVYPIYARAMKRRAKKCKPTSAAQERVNSRNLTKRVERLLNENFTQKDIWATFTWDDAHLPKDIDDAHRQVSNYIDRIRYLRKKKGLPPAKVVGVIEHSEKWKIRYNVHIAISGGISRDLIEKKWTGGRRTQTRRIQPDDDGLIGMATYITKATAQERKMIFSRNLKQPEVTVADKKISFKQVERMVSDETIAAEILGKLYPNYYFRGAAMPRTSAYIPGVYLEYRLRRRC